MDVAGFAGGASRRDGAQPRGVAHREAFGPRIGYMLWSSQAANEALLCCHGSWQIALCFAKKGITTTLIIVFSLLHGP